jgi:hypothetical protein
MTFGRGGQAARAQGNHHAPRHQTLACKTEGATRFGEGGKQQICAHSHVGLDAEEENQNGRHQRAAAHPGQTHDQAHKKASEYETKILHGVDCRGSLCQNQRFLCFTYMPNWNKDFQREKDVSKAQGEVG